MNYKIIFLLLLPIFLLSGFQVNAQSINYGIKAGINYSNFKTENAGRLDFEYKLLYNGGIYMKIPIKRKLTIQPELLYSAQGSKLILNESNLIGGTNPNDPIITGSKSDMEYSLNYLVLPVMINFNLYKGFFIGTGPQIGYLISAKRKVSDSSDSFFSNDNFKTNFENFTFDINLGLGYEFKSGLNLGFRYSLGLNNINKSDVFGLEYNNRVFQFSVAYTIFKKN